MKAAQCHNRENNVAIEFNARIIFVIASEIMPNSKCQFTCLFHCLNLRLLFQEVSVTQRRFGIHLVPMTVCRIRCLWQLVVSDITTNITFGRNGETTTEIFIELSC